MNYEHMQFIYDHVIHTCDSMESGEITHEADLIGPEPWCFVPPSEQQYVFSRPLAMLVAQGKLPLKFAGYDSMQRVLYRKT